MVLATVAIDKKRLEEIEELGVKDSKLLSPEKREALYSKIREVADHVEVALVKSHEIDSLRGKGTNLNKIEAMHIAKMVAKVRPDTVYVDSPHGGYPQRFENVIRSSTIENLEAEFICEHKADMNYPIVAAASIIAKVERDRAVEKIKKEIGFNCGSGYVADEITREFIDSKNGKAADKFMRKSWQPYKDLKGKEEQSKLSDF